MLLGEIDDRKEETVLSQPENGMQEGIVIGICGGSGSGKTTLLRKLAKEYQVLNPTVFSMDNYYRPIEEQHVDENGQVNFDLPDALDKRKLVQDLNALRTGKSVEVKEYHFNTSPNKNRLITLRPSQILIVEGLFLFHYEEVASLLDFSVFMKVSATTQLDRRLYRDQEMRGYSREDILYQWENHVTPCYKKYLSPYADTADFRFVNECSFDDEYKRLSTALAQKFKLEV